MAYSLGAAVTRNIRNNYAQNPDIYRKEYQACDEQSRDEGRDPKKLEIEALLKPKGLEKTLAC